MFGTIGKSNRTLFIDPDIERVKIPDFSAAPVEREFSDFLAIRMKYSVKAIPMMC